jgi:glutathione S-transferase
MFEDEPARTNWADIIELAERLKPEPRLVPKEAEQRIRMFGLANEICGPDGLTWNARQLMMAPMMKSSDENFSSMAEIMGKAYGFSEQAVAAAPQRIAEILGVLEGQLETQKEQGSRYFIGNSLTALDLIWASFSNTLRPLPEEVNPMDSGMRRVYSGTGDAANPPEILFEHRDYIYDKYIDLPLDF